MSQRDTRKRIPWYFLTELAFFIAPLLALLKPVWQTLNKKAFVLSMLIIAVLGYAWSMLVTSSQWWTFNPDTLLGQNVLPHLPLEEFLFYPLGGALCILLYVFFSRRRPETASQARLLPALMLACTAVAAASIFPAWQQGARPWYLISQLPLYNGLSLGLWMKIRQRVSPAPVLITTGIMAVIGFFWNWLAFTQGWWQYHAVLGWMWPPKVPVDDWNFYLFAPPAAVFMYAAWSKPT